MVVGGSYEMLMKQQWSQAIAAVKAAFSGEQSTDGLHCNIE